MAQPLALRSNCDARTLRGLARQSREAAPARRLLALAAIYDGASRTEAARLGSVTLQIVRDWVLRFNATRPDGLVDRKAPGQKSRLTNAHRAALAAIIERGPTPAVHGVVRWWIVDLCRWPVAPQDQRTASAYIFGAICPAEGKAAGLILPHCNTEAMSCFLAEMALAVAPGAHAVLIVDQAGWRLSRAQAVPPDITLLPLPPKCPELNPAENVWQFMRDNWLSNRVFSSARDVVDHCCHAWNKPVAQPWTIMSIGLRDWACRF